MSPRSEEYMVAARDHLAGARAALAGGSHGVAISAAYYAMLNAARAALSEQDKNARTHKGTWMLFRESFVDQGRFPPELLSQAQKAQGLRWRADYGAFAPTSEAAAAVVADAEGFLAAIEQLLA